MIRKEWWQKVFDDKYLKTYVDTVTPQLTQWQVSFIHKNLGLKKGAKIMDLACGHGRVSIELAKLGYQVTGLDYSKRFLEIAKTEAKKAGVKINFIRQDMRKLNFVRKFDAVINIFTSFGYFKSERDDIKIIQKVSRALKPGGKFFVDLNNIFRILSLMSKNGEVGKGGLIYGPVRREKLSNGLTVITRDAVDAATLHWFMTRTWREMGRGKSYTTECRLYSLPELKHLLEENGLRVRKVWGNFDGSVFSFASRRLIILAQK
jgi:2-polyprenyl-3-methyl-5-hydroxy-6-metoxy-1,4-benzoquinol methylase